VGGFNDFSVQLVAPPPATGMLVLFFVGMKAKVFAGNRLDNNYFEIGPSQRNKREGEPF